jgi:hypothetical protein
VRCGVQLPELLATIVSPCIVRSESTQRSNGRARRFSYDVRLNTGTGCNKVRECAPVKLDEEPADAQSSPRIPLKMSTSEKVLKETQLFRAALPALLEQHRGEWVVFLDGEVKSFHRSEEESPPLSLPRAQPPWPRHGQTVPFWYA